MGQMKDFLKKHREQQATAAVAEPKPMVPLVAIVPKDASTTAKALQTAQERTGSEKGKKAPAGQKEASGSVPGPTKAKAPAQPQKKKQFKPKFRLPDGAVFDMKYDGTEQKWNGKLIIGEVVYTNTAASIHYLLDKLGQAWRKDNNQKQTNNQPAKEPCTENKVEV